MAENKEGKRTVATFGIASLLNDLGAYMVKPLWPLFVTMVLGGNMVVLGLIDGIGDSLVSISQAVSGYLSDRFGKRKVFVWSGYLFGGISRIGYGLAPSWGWLVPFKVLDRTGKMRDSPRDAIIADVSVWGNRATNFGFVRAMDRLGAVFGIIASIILLGILGYRNLFMLAAVPSFIGALLILSMIKERKTAENVFKGISFRSLDRNLVLFTISATVFALGNFSESFLLVYAAAHSFSAVMVAVLYFVFVLVSSLLSLPFGRLGDKIGRKPIMALSYALFGIMCAAFALSAQPLIIVFLFVIYGAHYAALETIQRTMVSELAPAHLRASSLGAFQMITGIAALPASLVAGLLWVSVGSWLPFALSSILSVLAILLLLFVKEGRANK